MKSERDGKGPSFPGSHPCANPACRRWVSPAALYCCHGCDTVHNAHSDACDRRAAEYGERVAPDPVVTASARIARALDVTEKRLAIEMAYAALAPIVDHDILEVNILRARVAVAVDVLAQHVDRTTVPRVPRGGRTPPAGGRRTHPVAYPDEEPDLPPAA